MSNETDKNVNRRRFLRDSLGAAVMMGCFTKAELREALAQAKLTGKLVLTQDNLNKHIAFSAAAPPRSRNFQAFARQVHEFKLDPMGYITKHFHLTPAQQAEIEGSFNAEAIQKLTAFLDRAVKEKFPIKVIILRNPPHSPSESRMENLSPVQSRATYASLSFRRPLEMEYGVKVFGGTQGAGVEGHVTAHSSK
jgi:hypothetical protein